MKNIMLVIFGFILLLGSLRGGSWLCNELPNYTIAASGSGLIILIIGILMIATGLDSISKEKK